LHLYSCLENKDHLRKLETLELLCPNLVKLYVPLSTKFCDDSIELKFKIFSSASKVNVEKRRVCILDAMFEALFSFYNSNYTRRFEKVDFYNLLRDGKLSEELISFRFASSYHNNYLFHSETSSLGEKCSFADFLCNLKESTLYRGQISHIEHFLGRKAIFKSIDAFNPLLSDRLKYWFNTDGLICF
jgi:hypothetical protein